MTNNSVLYKSGDKSSLYASLIILATIILVFFGTTSTYSSYVEKSEQKNILEQKVDNLRTELEALKKKKVSVESDSETKKAINQFAGDYREDLIITQIYEKMDGIEIGDISMEKGSKLPNGLNMAGINFSLKAKNIDTLNKYLDYLTGKDAKIRFVIKSLETPLNSEDTSSMVQANLSLGMYYFDNK